MPGKCTVGPAAPVFNALDAAGAANEQLVANAQEACQSCLQLPHCEAQRAQIAQELTVKGVGQTVVGGVVVEGVIPDMAYGPFAGDTRLNFDLSFPLERPEHIVAILRQGLRSRQLYYSKPFKVQDNLADALRQQQTYPEWSVADMTYLSGAVAGAILKYRREKCPNITQKKIPPSFSPEEVPQLARIYDIFVKDALAIREAGFKDPHELTRTHSFDFYKAALAAAEKSYDITPGRFMDIMRGTHDPIPKIGDYMATNRHRKQQVAEGVSEASGELLIGEAESKAWRTSIIADKALQRYRLAPEIRPYLRKIYDSSCDKPGEAAEQLYRKVRSLRKDHEGVSPHAISYIAYYHPENTKTMIKKYLDNFAALQEKYGDHSDLTANKLSRWSYENLEDPESLVQKYLNNLEALRTRRAEAGVKLPESYLRIKANPMLRSDRWTIEQLVEDYEQSVLRMYHSSRRQGWSELPGWIMKGVIRVYKKDERPKALQNTDIFLKRGYLRIAYGEKKTEFDTPIDPEKGTFLTVAGDLKDLLPQEQQAVLHIFGLDKLVLGRQVDIDELKKIFESADIEGMVYSHIFPCTKAPDSRVPRSAEDLLYRTRVDSRRGIGYFGASKELAPLIEAAYSALILFLRSSAHETQPNLDDEFCQKAIRALLTRSARVHSGTLKKKRLLKELVATYLKDVDAMERLGLPRRVAYAAASHYDPSFCEHFLKKLAKEGVPRGLMAKLLHSAGRQPVAGARRYQAILEEYLPEFDKREISHSQARRCCANEMHHPSRVGRKLALYDKLKEQYGGFPRRVPDTQLQYFSFDVSINNYSEQRVKDWIAATAAVDEELLLKVGPPRVRFIAMRMKAPQENLDGALRSFITRYEDTASRYLHRPDAIDAEVVKSAIFITSKADAWLDKYLERWDYIQQNADTSDVPLPVLRRLLCIYPKDPLSGVKKYQALVEYFFDDPHISRWMIDEAVVWSVPRAYQSLFNLRRVLRAKTVYLDSSAHAGSRARLRHEYLTDEASAMSAEDHALGTNATSEGDKATIATTLENLSPVEKAAVGIVYDIPWLISDEQDQQQEKIFQALDVSTYQALEEKVAALLARVAAA